MDMALGAFAGDDAIDRAPRSFVRRSASVPTASPATLPASSSYTPRANRGAIVAVVLAHVAALWAMIHFDVIAIRRTPPQKLAVTMVEVAPPPPPHEEARVAPATKIETPVVAPPPVVALQPPPSPVIAAPPPPEPAVAPPAAPAPVAVAAPASPGPVAADILADVLDAPPPRFPAESRRLRESGTVRLRVVVSAGGRVAEVTVAKTSGFDRLDKAAMEAVRRWRFRPRVVAGSAAEAIGFVPVTFNPPH